MHNIDSRFVTGSSNILFVDVYLNTFQPGNVTSWGTEGVNVKLRRLFVEIKVLLYVHKKKKKKKKKKTVGLLGTAGCFSCAKQKYRGWPRDVRVYWIRPQCVPKVLNERQLSLGATEYLTLASCQQPVVCRLRYGAVFIHNEEFRKITLFLMLLLRLFVLFTCHNNLHWSSAGIPAGWLDRYSRLIKRINKIGCDNADLLFDSLSFVFSYFPSDTRGSVGTETESYRLHRVIIL